MTEPIPAQKIIVNTVKPSIIEMILLRVMKYNWYEFELHTWQDAFIAELLKWFDNKIEAIRDKKIDLKWKYWFDNNIEAISKIKIDSNYNDWFKHWKNYYEQIVRILYYFVIYMNVQNSNDLKRIFKYLFPENDNFCRDYDMISSEKLMKIYNYINRNTPHLKKDNEEREGLANVLIGKWNNEKMEYKLDNILVFNFKKIYVDTDLTMVLINDDNYNDDEVTYIKSKSDDVNKLINFIKLNYKTE